MPLCYHKEAFAVGIVTALFIVAIIHIFEDVIEDWLKRFLKLIQGV